MKRLDAANDNDVGKQIAYSRQVWQPRVGRDLTDEDAQQIIHNVTGFFGVLAEWSRGERLPAANDAATPANPNRGEVRHDRAETIARALGGRRADRTWMTRCPVHEDRRPSLSITTGKDGKVLVRCHAGCDQRDLIAALQERGLWQATGWASRIVFNHRGRIAEEPDADVLKRSAAALAVWQASQTAGGTPVATYLRSRGLDLPSSPALRFHNGLKHPSGGVWPAIVTLVTRGATGLPIAIHRTFLARDGRGKAPVDPAKMMLGPCRGGVVRLCELGDMLMVGEGIETCLAAIQATGKPAWAALSTSGLRSLDLPRDIRGVIVLADGDEPGEAAAQHCARRLTHEGRRVRIARPPNGMDFNDLLKARKPSLTEGAR